MSDAEKLLLRLLLDSGTLEVEARKMLGLPAAPAGDSGGDRQEPAKREEDWRQLPPNRRVFG